LKDHLSPWQGASYGFGRWTWPVYKKVSLSMFNPLALELDI